MANSNRKQMNEIDKKIAKELKRSRDVSSDSENIVKRFVSLLIVIVLIVVGIYFLSKNIVDNRSNNNEDNTTVAGEVNYDVISIGTLLNRPYEEYYVLAYNSEDTEAVYYSSLITKYQQKEGSIKIYYCDLSNSLNSNYDAKGGETNPKASRIEDLKLGKITLLKINNGKINKYIENVEEIKKSLQ